MMTALIFSDGVMPTEARRARSCAMIVTVRAVIQD